LRFLVGEVQKIREVARNIDFAALAFDFGQPLDAPLEGFLERRHRHSGFGEQRSGSRVFLVEQREQQMLGLDERVVAPERHALGIGQRLLKLGRKFIESHRLYVKTFEFWF
jgi:hypothetical protein